MTNNFIETIKEQGFAGSNNNEYAQFSGERVCFWNEAHEQMFFIKPKKFPVIFKSPFWQNRRFEVNSDGSILFFEEYGNYFSFGTDFGNELDLLKQATAESDKIRGEKK